MGKGVFTSDDTAVDHAKGVFRLIPQDELTALLAHPVTAAIYLREYCIPFFQETSLTKCLHMIHDLSSVHPDLTRDTDWLASRLSGGNAPPPGVEKDLMSTYNELLVATHEATPHRRLIKEYLVHKVEALPGCIGSSKGKRTKLSYLVEAIDNSTFKLFKQVDHGVFSKLLVDWTKLLHIMNNNGGADVFGDWATWCCPFDLLHLQEKWVGDAFTMQRIIWSPTKPLVVTPATWAVQVFSKYMKRPTLTSFENMLYLERTGDSHFSSSTSCAMNPKGCAMDLSPRSSLTTISRQIMEDYLLAGSLVKN